MRRGKLSLLAAVALVVLFLPACGNTPTPEGDFSGILIEDLPAGQKAAEQGQEGAVFLAVPGDVLSLEGFPLLRQNEGQLYRLNLQDEPLYSAAVKLKSWHTAGGRIRFRTSSPRIRLRVWYGDITASSNLSMLGSAGLDIYVGAGDSARCVAVVGPDSPVEAFTAEIDIPAIPQGGLQDIAINLPLYSGVQKIEIGFDTGSLIAQAKPHALSAPVVFYGSSITQGASASRPGSSYAQIVTRDLDAPLVNLGFSSGAQGEEVLANFVAGLDMAALVIDYDYNAENLEHLQNTHFNFYSIVRRAHPDLPIILLSRVNDAQGADDPIEARRAVIKETYDRARAAGDRNLYYIDGSTVMGESHRDLYFVDGVHPNDIGHLRIAEALLPVLQKALKL